MEYEKYEDQQAFFWLVSSSFIFIKILKYLPVEIFRIEFRLGNGLDPIIHEVYIKSIWVKQKC